MTVRNDELRFELTSRAEEEEWPYEKIEARVRYAIGKEHGKKEASRLPLVCLGPYFTYQIIRLESLHVPSGELLLDLGFKHQLEKTLFPHTKFSEGLIVTAAENSLSLTPAANANDESLYTYKARVVEVLDGDTLKLDFHLGLGQRQTETVRLNHIDCPELDTPEGKAAKRFVQNELANCDFITIKSHKTRKEKWGRYLADIFYSKKKGAPPVYLNQLLLDKGHAVRMKM
jgi:micrococcal nuclease